MKNKNGSKGKSVKVALRQMESSCAQVLGGLTEAQVREVLAKLVG